MKRRKLPVESPHWWPIADALEHRRQRTGANKLAAEDFNRALKAGDLRAQVRRANGSREELAASAWDDFHVNVYFGRKDQPVSMAVGSRKLGGSRSRDQWFFVWRPDYEKIFGPVAAAAEPRAQSQEVPEKRGRKQVHDRADLQSVALVLALQRKHGAPEKKPAEVVGELSDFCKRDNRKVPAESTLYEIVGAAYRIKQTLRKLNYRN